MFDFLIRYPLFTFITSVAGLGILQLLKQQLNTADPSVLLVVMIVFMHVIKLFLMAIAITVVIVTMKYLLIT